MTDRPDLEPKDYGAGDSDRRQTGTGTPMSSDGGGGAIDPGPSGMGDRASDDADTDRAIKVGASTSRSPDTGTDVGPVNRSGSGGSGGPTEGGADEEGSGALSMDEMLSGGSGEAEPRH